MVLLTKESLSTDDGWKALSEKEGLDVQVKHQLEDMVRSTKQNPTWAHIAPSNLFVAQIAPIAQELGIGIIGFETHDPEIVDQVYAPHDNLRLRVVMPSEGHNQISVIGSVADVFYSHPSRQDHWQKTLGYMAQPSLQLVSITCTEKGYRLDTPLGEHNLEVGPTDPHHAMGIVATMAYRRLLGGGYPIAFVSMDNLSQNGRVFKEAVLAIARSWSQRGLLDSSVDLPGYLETKVSFPWTMIDRITPRPSAKVLEELTDLGIEGMDIIETAMHTFAAPFVNTEEVSYLAIQDLFPNGRPDFAKADRQGNRIIMVPDTETIDKIERMKVGTCLNPLHTTLATSGVVLGYATIASMMKDHLMRTFVTKQAYQEGLPVVVNPGVIDPEVFLREVLEMSETFH